MKFNMGMIRLYDEELASHDSAVVEDYLCARRTYAKNMCMKEWMDQYGRDRCCVKKTKKIVPVACYIVFDIRLNPCCASKYKVNVGDKCWYKKLTVIVAKQLGVSNVKLTYHGKEIACLSRKTLKCLGCIDVLVPECEQRKVVDPCKPMCPPPCYHEARDQYANEWYAKMMSNAVAAVSASLGTVSAKGFKQRAIKKSSAKSMVRLVRQSMDDPELYTHITDVHGPLDVHGNTYGVLSFLRDQNDADEVDADTLANAVASYIGEAVPRIFRARRGVFDEFRRCRRVARRRFKRRLRQEERRMIDRVDQATREYMRTIEECQADRNLKTVGLDRRDVIRRLPASSAASAEMTPTLRRTSLPQSLERTPGAERIPAIYFDAGTGQMDTHVATTNAFYEEKPQVIKLTPHFETLPQEKLLATLLFEALVADEVRHTIMSGLKQKHHQLKNVKMALPHVKNAARADGFISSSDDEELTSSDEEANSGSNSDYGSDGIGAEYDDEASFSSSSSEDALCLSPTDHLKLSQMPALEPIDPVAAFGASPSMPALERIAANVDGLASPSMPALEPIVAAAKNIANDVFASPSMPALEPVKNSVASPSMPALEPVKNSVASPSMPGLAPVNNDLASPSMPGLAPVNNDLASPSMPGLAPVNNDLASPSMPTLTALRAGSKPPGLKPIAAAAAAVSPGATNVFARQQADLYEYSNALAIYSAYREANQHIVGTPQLVMLRSNNACSLSESIDVQGDSARLEEAGDQMVAQVPSSTVAALKTATGAIEATFLDGRKAHFTSDGAWAYADNDGPAAAAMTSIKAVSLAQHGYDDVSFLLM